MIEPSFSALFGRDKLLVLAFEEDIFTNCVPFIRFDLPVRYVNK